MKFILLLLLTFTFLSCSSKKKEEKLGENAWDSNIVPQDQAIHPDEESQRNESPTEENEEYFYTISSKLDVKKIEEGNPVYIKCDGNEYLQMIHLCRMGFSKRELDLGSYMLDTQKSYDFYKTIESDNIRDKLIRGEVLVIQCKDSCVLSQGERNETVQ